MFKRVVVIGADYPALEQACPHWSGIKAGLSRLPLEYKFISCRPTLNVQDVIGFNPDLVVYGLRDMVIHKDWRREIRAALPNAVIVLWYGDLRNENTTQIDANCSELDAMFVSNDAQGEYYQWKWKVKEVHYLPLGCEPIPDPVIDERFRFPLVFIGGQITAGAFNARAHLIENFRLKAGLKVVNSFEPKMRAKIFKSMPAIYSSSKITLDISHFTDIQGYTSIRFFEIPAFFGFALTKRFPGCEKLYPEDTRAYFDTYEEAIEKKDYYIAHEKERMEMVDRAHKLSYSHTYDLRFKDMFKKL